MSREDFLDALDLVARIDHHGFASGLIPHNRAVAGQHPHRKDFMDHWSAYILSGFTVPARLGSAWPTLAAVAQPRLGLPAG
jgi:hypothetical protein